ncbi:dual specificity protein kinase splA [Salix suchowensis]|nr:dual specificity protein kinase splA [Salix suchowensis]
MESTAPPAEELLKKIQQLEAGHHHLQQQMTKLKLSSTSTDSKPTQQRSHSISPQRSGPRSRVAGGPTGSKSRSLNSNDVRDGHSNGGGEGGDGNRGGPSLKFTDKQYLNILQSVGQSVHIFDHSGRIIYWNRTAENLYGYSAAEALGQDAIELLIDPRDYAVANGIVQRVSVGEKWTGKFPVKNKMAERFTVVATNTPLYDDGGALVGVICVSSDSQPFQGVGVALLDSRNVEAESSYSRPRNIVMNKLGLDSQQPLQKAVASKISNLASKVSNKVKSKIRSGENNMDHEGGSGDSHYTDHGGASTPRGDVHPSPFGLQSCRDSGDESEGKPAFHKIITSKAEAWIGKKGLSWPWKGNEKEGSEARTTRFGWPWLHNDQESETFHQRSPSSGAKSENHVSENNRPANNEASGSWSSSINVNSTSSAGSYGSTSSTVNKVDLDTDCLDYEILWEDLIIREQIGQGSCGTVYHALWYGSDVAVKVFRQEYSEDIILAFKQEVSLMKRLRHPNVLLFMVGSLFRLLQRNTTKLDLRRRAHMALDIARGMNYLHHYNPPIIHRDLKSSNLLVDKNWTVKVGDFGLSRLKHETYLTTKTGKGTPQWMAPEVLRNEPSDEKSDVYSYGVILWELATEKIPWDNLNSMQFCVLAGDWSCRVHEQQLEIPKDVDPQWASILGCRPTFQELLEKLKDLQRQYAIQFQAARSAAGDNTRKEL